MTGRLAGALAVAVLAVGMSACSSDSATRPGAPRKVVQETGKSVVAVDADGDGAQVTLRLGQELRVALPNDTSTVDADMGWRVAEAPAGVVEVLGSRFERLPWNVNPSEAAGVTVWRLRPIAAGHGHLSFELRKSRTVGAPVQTVGYDLTVQ